MGRTRAATATLAVVAAVAVSGCGATDAFPDREPLEQLHGPIDPAVLDRPIQRPTPPPVTALAGSRWRVSNVLDGRTLELFQGLERVTATLAGISVPVGDECQARLATDSLAFITGGSRPVDVSPSTPIGNRIDDAVVLNADGDDVALLMLSLGLASVAATAVPASEAYSEMEATARREGVGIWSDECDDEG